MRIIKWDVPVDGIKHEIGGGRVVMVDWQMPAVEVLIAMDNVHVWTEEGEPREPPREVIVIPDEQEYDEAYCQHLGSTQTFHAKATRSWHVLEVFDTRREPCALPTPHDDHTWDSSEGETVWCPGIPEPQISDFVAGSFS